MLAPAGSTGQIAVIDVAARVAAVPFEAVTAPAGTLAIPTSAIDLPAPAPQPTTAIGHASGYVDSLGLTVVLLIAGLGAAGILGLAIAALLRRRSTPYLLVALAIATILARTLVAGASLQGMVAAGDHHLLEHGLDVVMVALVVAAVYTARTTPGPASE